MLSLSRAGPSRLRAVISRMYSAAVEVPRLETLAVSVPKPFVFHVELNRPEKVNTFNNTMWSELRECFDSLSENPECRVIVLSGRGRLFTGGIDLYSMMEWAQKLQDLEDVARKCKFLNSVIKRYQDGISSLETCAKPVLSVVHGACVGAGVDLITAADIRYCTKDAWFQVKEADIGMAADVGTLQRFPKVVSNMSIARELCFTARKFDAEEAKDIGLVGKVFSDKDSALKEALDVAENIAAKSPVAVQVTKQNLVYSLSRPNQKGLDHIRAMNQVMLQSEDFSKACLAQASKGERPEFDNFALKEALDVAENIAAKSPVAVQVTKQNLVYSLSRPNQKGLDHIRAMNQVMLQSEDFSKACLAQASKGERPEFDNL